MNFSIKTVVLKIKFLQILMLLYTDVHHKTESEKQDDERNGNKNHRTFNSILA